MAGSSPKTLRCAIYTRKSTEHGLDLEFNSLDAQREACEAYIKSQASQGWRALPQHYDDPAFSGGNLERPALQRLLKDIDAGLVDVVVVYKIDRLTRSLADFAKLVEAFDAKSVSFVAITQQFNTTTSMGRLTLNILLSFAQFERELSSERVRDKVAASRRKGKWTGGTVPLGYDTRDKKLVVNPDEAKTVRHIFRRYLELKSFSLLVQDLDRHRIVTKRRSTKVAKYNGAIPFTYGPLAYLLKNRVYVGEIGHAGKWFPGEHQPIIDQKVFDQVQALLSSNSIDRKARRTESGALLQGKLYDDRGNLMSPSYSTKNGIRYRFYVSSALLRGRKTQVGSVGRVAAQEIETAILAAVRNQFGEEQGHINDGDIAVQISRVVVSHDRVVISLSGADDASGENPQSVQIPWQSKAARASTHSEGGDEPFAGNNEALVQSIVRARAWIQALTNGTFDTIEDLARSAHMHPKVVRQELRFAYLPPKAAEAVLKGRAPKMSLPGKNLTLPWSQYLDDS